MNARCTYVPGEVLNIFKEVFTCLGVLLSSIKRSKPEQKQNKTLALVRRNTGKVF